MTQTAVEFLLYQLKKRHGFVLDDNDLDQTIKEAKRKERERNEMTSDSIVLSVISKFNSRSLLGIKKYGTTLEQNDTDDFLGHLQEELMDAVLYIEKIKQLRNEWRSECKS
jgi:hypothetical protein